MFRLVFTFFLLFFFKNLTDGQSASPFDLVHRLPKTAVVAGADSLANVLQNPFDVRPHRVPGAEKSKLAKSEKKVPLRHRITLPKGKSSSKTFLFWTLVGMLGFLGFSISVNRSVVAKAWRGFLNDNSLSMAHRESLTQAGALPYTLLYANFLLNAGIFMFLILRAFRGEDFNNPYILLLCAVGIVGIFFLKHVLLRVVGWLFPVAAEMNRYNFTIIVFNCVLGFFLVGFNFLIAFSGEFQGFLIFWVIGLVLLFYGYRALRSLLLGSKFLAGSLFHFLLYLCAAEIAPVLILFKMATQ